MGFESRLKALFGFDKKKEKKTHGGIIDKSIETDDNGSRWDEDEFEYDSSDNGQSNNFRWLDALIHSGAKEIVLNSNVILDDEELSEYSKGIKLDVDDLIIDGNGHVIDACEKTRIFLSSGKNITITNAILKGGLAKKHSSEDGGAIFNHEGNLNLINVTVINSKAEFGGAIYNKSGKVNISDSRFKGNNAHRYQVGGSDGLPVGPLGGGGAIYSYEGEVNITDSIFFNNTSNGDGGAICCSYTDMGISDSEFIDNESGKGGAIHNNHGKMSISRTKLQNNTQKGFSGGGAISNDYGMVKISETKLEGNSASSGGAVYNLYGNVYIEKSSLYSNESSFDGGAIGNYGNVKIRDVAIVNNVAKRFGGAIHNYQGEISVEDALITRNVAENGGVIYNEEGNFKIMNCEILTNQSKENLIINKEQLQVHNTNFRDNQSKCIIWSDGEGSNLSIFNGGLMENDVDDSVIYNDGKSCTVEGVLFENNLSQDGSKNIINKTELALINPKIENDEKTILNENLLIFRKPSPELENKICGEGTILIEETLIPQEKRFDFGYLDKKIHDSENKEYFMEEDICFEIYEKDFYEGGIELDIDDLVIDGNGKEIDGNGKSRIFIITGKNIMLKNITFKNGYAHRNRDNPLNSHGGAIRILPGAELRIENCKFLNNISEDYGGAIENHFSDVKIKNATFDENIANGKYEGGGAVHNYWGNMDIADSSFNGNKSGGEYAGGGAVYNNHGDMDIADSTFADNKSGGGGAIASKKGVGNIAGAIFDENVAAYGGAIYNQENELNIAGVTFIANRSQEGGAISNRKGEMGIAKSTFKENKSSRDGGAIYNTGKIDIAETLFDGNNSKSSSGAIKNNEGQMNIAESTFSANTAYSAGAIHNQKGVMRIVKSALTENTSSSMGGAICNDLSGELNIAESTFSANTANAEYSRGGAIENRATLNIKDVTFDGNKSMRYGGAIHNGSGELTISDSIFADNMTEESGGAIYYDKYKPELINCTFKGNKPLDESDK